MSDYELDDELLRAVRAARPAIPQDVLSQTGPEAQAVLERVMALNRRRRRVAAPSRWRPRSSAVTGTDPVPGLETSIDRKAAATRPTDGTDCASPTWGPSSLSWRRHRP
jgi:hypothetical protein